MNTKKPNPKTSKSLKFLLTHSLDKDQPKLPILQQNIQSHSVHIPDDNIQSKLSSNSHHKQLSQQTNSLPLKWQSIATKMNNQLHIQKLIYNRSSTSNMLIKYGGRVYRSESKGNAQQERKDSLQKSRINQRPITREGHQQDRPEDSAYKYLKQADRKNLRKRSRLPTNSNNLITKQLSINKLFYENPVRKIGFNMQFEAKFKFEHLERLLEYKDLQKDNYTNINARVVENPIVYCLKDCPFSAHIITEKNLQSPICVSLFPEFFHSKLSTSNYVRQRYLQKMWGEMNNTYDPGVMGTMPLVTNHPNFNMEAYVTVLRQFVGNFESLFDPQWAENIMRRVRLSLSSTKAMLYLREIWDLFNKSIGMANLDYILKDGLYIEKFGISPYLPTKYITSKRILYHGGYSKFLYPGWASYVRQGRKGLQTKLKKYNEVAQSVWAWLVNFQSKLFFEIDFIKVLKRPVSVSLFKKLQQRHINQTKQFLSETWMRGVILIWQEGLFMQRDREEYRERNVIEGELMREEILMLRRDLNEIKGGNKAMGVVEQRIMDSYERYLKGVRVKTRKDVRSQSDLLPIYGRSGLKQGNGRVRMSSNAILPTISELKTLISIHYSQIVQRSIKCLRSLIVQGRKSRQDQRLPVLRLTLIVDRQNIKFRQKEEEIIQCFGQLIQQVFKHQLSFFGVKMEFASRIQINQGQKEEKQVKDHEKNEDRTYQRKNKWKFQPQMRENEKQRLKTIQGDRLKEPVKRSNSNNKHTEQDKQPQHTPFSYPQIKIVPITSQPDQTQHHNHSSSTQTIHYHYPFNHEKQINSLLFKLHEYYKESLKVISLFQQFMPFIKLTTSKYIFHEEHDQNRSAEDVLLKDLAIINRYREELAKIQIYQKVKVFQISCEEPLTELRTRMNQVEYLTEQRYLNKVFDQIHQTQKKLAQIKKDIQTRQVKINNFDQLQQKIATSENQMLLVETCLKQLERKILFCFSVDKANSTLILRYEQVINKKKDLENEVTAFKTFLKGSRPALEERAKRECYDVALELNSLKEEFHALQEFYIDAGQVEKFLGKIDSFGQKVTKYDAKMKECLESAEYVLPMEDIDEKLEQFKSIQNKYVALSQFWKGVFAFQSYLRQRYKDPIRRLNVSEFEAILFQSEKIIVKLHAEDNSSCKSFIHKCQQHFLRKFEEDITSCTSLKDVIETLCNLKIQERHWKEYGCEGLREMTLYELMKQGVSEETIIKLKEMNAQAEMEFRVYDVYETIRKQLKCKKIRIIDVNGSDVLDVDLALQTLDMLYNWKIECESLLVHTASGYFHDDIAKLLHVIDRSYSQLMNWREMEKCYIRITNYYVPNEENLGRGIFGVFDQLRQTHRKLIKSFDSNDSIWYISENIILGFYCAEIEKRLGDLKVSIGEFMAVIRNKYPRLYLLNDEELLAMMSSGAKIQKLVSKCFPHIEQIDIKQGAIEHIGRKKHLKFFQSIYILDKLSMVYEWMPKLEQTIKKNMRDLYKTNFITTITNSKKPSGFAENYPLQLSILDELVDFTHTVEDALLMGSLEVMAEAIKKKIRDSVKASSDSTLTLLYIKFRETINELISQEVTNTNDFTWYRHARFYCPQSLSHIQPLIQITNHTYEYGFNYHENPQITFHEHCFYGNTFIGEPQTGKKSIARHYAYVTGMEMLVFEVDGKQQNDINTLVDWVKIAAWAGAWLYVDGMEMFGYEELCVVSECIDAVQRALVAKEMNVSILGEDVRLNKDVKLLMSLTSLNNEALPCILIEKLRPMWVTKPNDSILLRLFLEAKTYSYEKVSEFMSFCSWVEHGDEHQKCIMDWVRKENDKGFFRLNSLFIRMLENGYLYRMKELMGENDRNNQLSNIARNIGLNLDDEISFVSYGGMLIYGQKNTGKTQNVLKILEKYCYLYVDMRLYEDKQVAVQEIVNKFNELNPVPQFLLIRDGIQYYQAFHQLVEENVRLVFVESDLRFLHFSLLQNISTLNYNQLLYNQYSRLYPHLQDRIRSHPEQLLLKRILGTNYDLIISNLYLDLLIALESLLQKHLPLSNIKISFAKLLDSLLKEGYGYETSVMFATIWTFGSYLEDSQIMNVFADTFCPCDDEKRTKLLQAKLWDEKMVQLINKTNLWLKEGKIQSLFDLVPVPSCNSFSNNLTIKIDFSLTSFDHRAVSLQLGMLSNLKMLRQLNPELKIKLQAKEWLSSILKEWLVAPNVETLLLTQSEWLRFPQIMNKILHRVRKNKSTYMFPTIRHIVIDDLHLHSVENYLNLEHLATYKSVLFVDVKQSGFSSLKKTEKFKSNSFQMKNFSLHDSGSFSVDIDHFRNSLTKVQLKNCGFTLGTKMNLTNAEDEKGICLRFKQGLVQNIYREYLRSFWSDYLTLDMGVNELLSLSYHLSKKVQEQFSLANYKLYPFYLQQRHSRIFSIERTPLMQNRLFWLKNPLLLAMRTQPAKLSTVFLQYLKIMADVLPSQVEKIENMYYSVKINIVSEDQGSSKSVHLERNEIVNQDRNAAQNQQVPDPFNRQLKMTSEASSIPSQNVKNTIIQLAQQKLDQIDLKKILHSQQIQLFLRTCLQEEQEFVSDQGVKHFEVQKVNSALKLSSYMKEYILKVYRQLKHNNLILLGELHTQREKIYKIACKMLGWKIVQFEATNLLRKIMVACEALENDEKLVVTFRSSDLNKKNMEDLFHILKFRDFKPWMAHNEQGKSEPFSQQKGQQILSHLRFLLKINMCPDGSTQQMYETFPILKTHFVNVYFQAETQDLMSLFEDFQEEKKVLKSGDTELTNDLEMQWKADILYLYHKYGLAREFLISFPETYRANKESEYEKLEYYRKITSEMVVNIDRLSTYSSSIPNKILETTEICYKIQEKKAKIRKEIEKIRQARQQTEMQVKNIEQLLQDSENNKDTLNEKMEKIMAPTATKIERIEKKIETMESGEFLKVKAVIKNEHVILIVAIINLLMDQDVTTKQKPVYLTLPFTRSSLLSALKQVKKRCSHPQTVEQLQFMELSQAKITQTREKIEQLRAIGGKKVQKNGGVFKFLFDWIMLYYDRKTIFDDYYMKFKYTFTHLQTELSQLSGHCAQAGHIGDMKDIQPEQSFKSDHEDFQDKKDESKIDKYQPTQQYRQQPPAKFKKIQTESQMHQSPPTSANHNSPIEDPTAIRRKLQQQRQRLTQFSSRIQLLNEQKENLSKNEKALHKHKNYLNQKMQNLSTIIASLGDMEYMKNVSSNIASYFKDIPKISFLKTLLQLKYNEYIDDDRLEKYRLDISHYFNVFSQDEAVRQFRIKYGLYHMLQDELECLYNVVMGRKGLVVIEDEEEVIEEDLVKVCLSNGYHLISVNYEPLEEIEELILKKIKNYSKILVLNTNYLNLDEQRSLSMDLPNQSQSHYQIWPNFDEFIYRCHQQLSSFSHQTVQNQKKIIILNYTQPNIRTEFFKHTNHGKIHLTFERFMTDLTAVFQLISISPDELAHTISKLQKKDSFLNRIDKSQLLKRQDLINSTNSSNPLQMATKKPHKSTKQLLWQVLKINQHEKNTQNYWGVIGKIQPDQIQLLISEQNTKMKQNIKIISALTQVMVQKSYEVFQITDQEIQLRLNEEEKLIKDIEENLSQISLIQQIIQLNSKSSSNYKDQSPNNKAQLQRVTLPFFWIFNYLKKISHTSSSPIFGVRELYREWIKCLKGLKSENHLLFNFQPNVQKKYQLNFQSSDSQHYRKDSQKEVTVISDVFRVNMKEIIKMLVIKLGKSIVWQEKVELYRFLIVGFIAFFISMELVKAKQSLSKSVKELLETLLMTSRLDKDVEGKIEKVQKLLNQDRKNTSEGTKLTTQQLDSIQKNLTKGNISSDLKEQKQNKQGILVRLIKLFSNHDNTICELIQCLRTKSISNVQDQNVLELYERLKDCQEVLQIIKEVFNFKHHFQMIRSSTKNHIEEPLERIGTYQLNVSIDFKESEITSSLIIIEENESAIGMVLENLRQKAKIYKREWVSLIYNDLKSEQTFKILRRIQEKGKTWIYLVNFTNSATHINSLKRIMFELDKTPKNPTTKVFIVIPSKKSHPYTVNKSPQRLLYNKYEISKITSTTMLDFQQLTEFILDSVQRLEQTHEDKQMFSIKTLQKIAATHKQLPNQPYTIGEIYDSIIMGFRLLSQKHKLYSRKALCSHFVIFLQTFEDLYKKTDRSGKIGYFNAIKFLYQNFKAISNYSLENVKNQVEINLNLKRESLSCKRFGQGQAHLEQFQKQSRLLDQFRLDYLSLAQGEKTSPVKAVGLKRRTIEVQTEQTLKAFMRQAILRIAQQIVTESNQLYLKNLAINCLSNEIVQTYYKTGLNIHRRNPQLYERFQQRNLASLLHNFQQYITLHTPVSNFKLWKNSIKEDIYKVRSAQELLKIFNNIKFLHLKNSMRNNKSKGEKQLDKGQKVQYGFFVDKEKIENSLSSRFLLKSLPKETIKNEQSQQDKIEDREQGKTCQTKTFELSVQDLQGYFLQKKVLKQTFALYFAQEHSKEQGRGIEKRYTEKGRKCGLSKQQVEQIMERYALFLDYSTKGRQIVQQQSMVNQSQLVCLIQIFIK